MVSQRCLCDQAQGDVHALAPDVINPAADLVVLQSLVDGKSIEKEEQGDSYFSCSAPNMIIDAFTAKIEKSAATSVIPVIWATSQIITEELREYSVQRK